MRTALAALAFVFAGACSNPEGRECRTTDECGAGFVCEYWDRLFRSGECGEPGHCRRATGPCERPADSSLTICTCDDQTLYVDGDCSEAPAVVRGIPCETVCDHVSSSDPWYLHPGPRDPDEYCAGLDWYQRIPARCCDCSLAIPGPTCAASTHRLPDGCCERFTEGSPDPTGLCVPPDGEYPTSGWHCAIRESEVFDAGG